MARGAPDDSNVLSPKPIHTVTDLGELAARLGSIDLFDRAGNVVWMDDFEAPLIRWGYSFSGAGSGVYLQSTYQLMGNQGVQLIGGSDSYRDASIYRLLAYPLLGSFGFECAFAFNDQVQDITIELLLLDHTRAYRASIKYDTAARTLSYADITGLYQVIASGVWLWPDLYLFHQIKIVADYVTHNYVRVHLDEAEYDLGAIPLWEYPTGTVNLMEPFFTIVSLPGVNGICIVDNAIVTQNEP